MKYGPWRVLHVAANQEKRVAQHLTARSLEYYLPLFTERSRWTDRAMTRERPLFPGYVFVRFAPDARLSVISIPGTLRLLGCKGTDAVECAEIDRIRESLATGLVLRPHPPIILGTRVRICRGIFENVEGTVTELRRNCRVVIALSAVQQYFSLEADRSEIEILAPTCHLHRDASPAASLQM